MARDTATPHVDNRPPTFQSINSQPSTNVKLREYKAVLVVNDQEVRQLSDEIASNRAQLV